MKFWTKLYKFQILGTKINLDKILNLNGTSINFLKNKVAILPRV
jgi:hypothetical protein